jgi:hypothetical protein
MRTWFLCLLCVATFAPVPIAWAQTIQRVEWFMNTDPGFGNGTQPANFSPTTGSSLTDFEFDVPVGSLADGLHVLYARAKDNNNFWSNTHTRLVVKETLPTLPKVDKLEYFIDALPAVDIPLPTPNSSTLTEFAFDVDLSATTLAVGIHTLYVRARDEQGKWSVVHYRVFVKENAPSLANIDKLEYFFSHNPAQVVDLPITAGAELQDVPFELDVSALPDGVHTLYVRARNTTGLWSVVVSRLFVKETLPALPNLAKLEWYVGKTDGSSVAPAYDSGIAIPLSAVTEVSNLDVNIDLSQANISLALGTQYTVFIRAKDAVGKWSVIASRNFTFSNTVPPSSPTLTSAVRTSNTQAALTWTDVTGETGYRIMRAGSENGVFTKIDSVGANITTYNNVNLANGTPYCYRIIALNGTATSLPSNTLCVSSAISPPAPELTKLERPVNEKIQLAWTDVTGETGYRIMRSVGDNGIFVKIDSVNANVTTYENTNLTDDTKYCYQIIALNGTAVSAPSNIKCSALTPIERNALEVATHIFPNPSDGFFKVVVSLPAVQGLAYTLSDAQGRALWAGELGRQGEAWVLEIDLHTQPKAIYFLEIRTKDKRKIVKRLIKQ